MKNFFKQLLSSTGSVSSKIVVGIWSMFLLTGMVIANVCFGTNIQEALIWAVVGIIVGCFSLNAAIAMKAIGAKSQVASDIVKEDPSSDNADASKDVLTSDKP